MNKKLSNWLPFLIIPLCLLFVVTPVHANAHRVGRGYNNYNHKNYTINNSNTSFSSRYNNIVNSNYDNNYNDNNNNNYDNNNYYNNQHFGNGLMRDIYGNFLSEAEFKANLDKAIESGFINESDRDYYIQMYEWCVSNYNNNSNWNYGRHHGGGYGGCGGRMYWGY